MIAGMADDEPDQHRLDPDKEAIEKRLSNHRVGAEFDVAQHSQVLRREHDVLSRPERGHDDDQRRRRQQHSANRGNDTYDRSGFHRVPAGSVPVRLRFRRAPGKRVVSPAANNSPTPADTTITSSTPIAAPSALLSWPK